MASLSVEEKLTRIEKKIDRLLASKRQRDERLLKTNHNQRYYQRKQIVQLKADKLALIKYIRELETFLKLQRADDKDETSLGTRL